MASQYNSLDFYRFEIFHNRWFTFFFFCSHFSDRTIAKQSATYDYPESHGHSPNPSLKVIVDHGDLELCVNTVKIFKICINRIIMIKERQ